MKVGDHVIVDNISPNEMEHYGKYIGYTGTIVEANDQGVSPRACLVMLDKNVETSSYWRTKVRHPIPGRSYILFYWSELKQVCEAQTKAEV